MKAYLIIAGIFILASCTTKSDMESPLVTVIKLNSAESLLDFEEASKYLDVEKAYSKTTKANISADQAWREYIQFNYNLGQDNKFTNIFKYHNYDIKESYNGSNGKVIFKALNPSSKIQEIIYSLESIDSKWKVVDIEYVKSQ